MKYSILMPYVARAGALHNTLVSFAHHYAGRQDYEVLVLEDRKNVTSEPEHRALVRVLEEFQGVVPLRHIKMLHPSVSNPVLAYNDGARTAEGEYLVLTSPEVFHRTDVLAGMDQEFGRRPNGYVVCACEAARDGFKPVARFEDFHYAPLMWYQHSAHRDVRYHFCTGIRKDTYWALGGMDEDFAEGIAYEDNDFLDRVELSGLPMAVRDDLHTVHIWHPKLTLRAVNYRQRVARNKDLYLRKRAARRAA